MPGRPVGQDRYRRQNSSEDQCAIAQRKNAIRDFAHTLAASSKQRGEARFTRNFEHDLQLQRSVSHPIGDFVVRKPDIDSTLVPFVWWALATIVLTLVVAIRIRL